MVDYYKAEKLTEHITAIKSRSGEIMYLTEGNDKACLIDTCVGIKGLRSLAESVTDKPLTVLLTHGHVDHAMGAPEFDEVYMNSKDHEVYTKHSPLTERKGYIAASLGGEEGWMKNDENFVPVKEPIYKELQDESTFELGGINLEVYQLPGHTKGTMIVLIPEEKILITGDACNTATFLFDENSLTVEEYKENLSEVQEKLTGRFDRIFMMHHDIEASKNLLQNVIDVCDDILQGNADDMEFEFMGQMNYIAKNVGEGFKRLDGGEGNIVYNKEKITKGNLLR